MIRYPGRYIGGTVRREALAGVGLRPWVMAQRLAREKMWSKYSRNTLEHESLHGSDSAGLDVSDLPSRKPDPGIANPQAGQC